MKRIGGLNCVAVSCEVFGNFTNAAEFCFHDLCIDHLEQNRLALATSRAKRHREFDCPTSRHPSKLFHDVTNEVMR